MATILVIDDEISIAEMLVDLLEDEGHQVVTARNGREGLERMAEVRPELVLCDMMMPVMDGREFCRMVRTEMSYAMTPIVLMSAGQRPSIAEDGLYTTFLAKPMNIMAVIETVDTCLQEVRQNGHR